MHSSKRNSSQNCNVVEKLGKQAEARIYVQVFHGKTRTNNKTKTKGNKEQNDRQTDNYYIQQLTKKH